MQDASCSSVLGAKHSHTDGQFGVNLFIYLFFGVGGGDDKHVALHIENTYKFDKFKLANCQNPHP